MADQELVGETESTDDLELLRERNRQLQEALASRIEIEQAKGILAERLELSTDEAFALLQYAARTQRMKIHELARRVRPGEQAPMQITIAMERTEHWRADAHREVPQAEHERVRREHLRRVHEGVRHQTQSADESAPPRGADGR